ncbi:MAG: hypothetical protein JXB18_06155 [Sedimentisphaerales bacterium]|nr:hypothetical protein [Sedimentisphaerales bacterium]
MDETLCVINTDIDENGMDVQLDTQLLKKNISSLFLVFLFLTLFLGGCDNRPENKPDVHERTRGLKDNPLAEFQCELLEHAFQTATMIPVIPHLKDRSRAQAAVVEACLELNQAEQALTYIAQIKNWRQGACYADLAMYCARHGLDQDVQKYLEMAKAIAEKEVQGNESSDNSSQEWRRDHIRTKIAQTYVWLGLMPQAEEIKASEVSSERGKLAIVKAMKGDESTFEKQVKSIDELIAMEHYDIILNGLKACAQIFKQDYQDEQKRNWAEEKIKTSWAKLPFFIRVELLTELANAALGHNDAAKAIKLVDEAQEIIDSRTWDVEHLLPMSAKLISVRFRAGDTEKAKSDADFLFIRFEAEKQTIANIYRAGTLRPLAEAFQSMGNKEVALSIYKKAVEEGIDNPNSRPRAEDLSATCCSMALFSMEPDVELWSKLRQIRDGLGQPW